MMREHRRCDDALAARRFEILDSTGTVRGRFGVIGSAADGSELVGLELLDHRGRSRVTVSLGTDGPTAAFECDGNGVLVAGVDDGYDDPDSDVVAPGPYVTLCRDDGRPVLEWRVAPDGDIQTATSNGSGRGGSHRSRSAKVDRRNSKGRPGRGAVSADVTST